MEKKILFICTVLPTENIGAGRRTMQIASLLSSEGKLTVLLASELNHTAQQLDEIKQLFPQFEHMKLTRRARRSLSGLVKHVLDSKSLAINPVEASRSDKHRIVELVETHDVVWIHTLKAANAFRIYRWPSSVLDLDDVPSKWLDLAARFQRNPLRRLVLRMDARLRRRSESHLQDRFDALALCNSEDRFLFADPSRVFAIANGFSHEVPRTDWEPSGSRRIGMIGTYGYLPNRDGALWFLREVWPLIRSKVVDAELVLVGKGGGEIVSGFPDKGVLVRGFVPNLDDEIKTWAGMIVPTRMGGGTHVKVAEGMAMGLPMVSTSHGCRGYEIINGKEILLADDAISFGEACVQLMENQKLQGSLSLLARGYFERRLTWSAIAPDVERAVRFATKRAPRRCDSRDNPKLIPTVAGNPVEPVEETTGAFDEK